MTTRFLIAVFVLCCWEKVDGHGTHLRNDTKDFIYSTENDRMTTLIETDSHVSHIEPDLFIKGNILYTDGCALKTTDGVTSTTIAGHSTTCYHHFAAGLLARFHELKGFRQISPSEVVVADHYQHCLKLIDRITLQVSRYAGYCGSYGYGTGTSGARFNRPHTIISDIKRPGMLLVTDSANDAVRHVNILSSSAPHSVSNFYQQTSYLDYPRGITQHHVSGDLYITNDHDEVWRVTYSSTSISNLAGTPANIFRNCDFSTSYFHSPHEIIFIGENKLMLADYGNHRLRILNLKTSHTSSVCTGRVSHIDGDMETCTLYLPRSLMVLNDTLYVGEYQRIRKVQDKRITACAAPSVARIASEDTGVAELDLPLLEGAAKMQLYPGLYPLDIRTARVNCTITIKVLDHRVRRRLYFDSVYSLTRCETAPGTVTNSSLLYTMAEHSYRQLADVCMTDCSRASNVDIKLTCANNTLTVSWPTDVSYNGSVVGVPTELKQTLDNRIQAKGAAFHLVMLTNTPPVVFPEMADNGGYTKPRLRSYCHGDDYRYNPIKDACEK